MDVQRKSRTMTASEHWHLMPKRGKVFNLRVSTLSWPRTKARKGLGWEKNTFMIKTQAMLGSGDTRL